MKIQKFFGWILLALGLVIVSYSLLNSFSIFTGKSEPPTVFGAGEEKESAVSSKTQNLQEEAAKLLEETLQKQLIGMVPLDALPRLLNLISWSIFAGILIFGGAQISFIGVNLLKK